ncbi:MAG: FAD:protein FMN transferase [Pseudomonadales bacterium]|nr:FAD:protein FMN transferase [Pseudomonadales bacterium]
MTLRNRLIASTFAFQLVILCTVQVWFTRPALAQWNEEEWTCMGTTCSVKFWTKNPETAVSALRAAQEIMTEYDNELSPYKDNSLLSRINKRAHLEPIKLDDRALRILKKAKHYYEITGGAFDVTFASAGHLYDYRKAIVPSDTDLEKALDKIGSRLIYLDYEHSEVSVLESGVKLDLGGIAKGAALDEVVKTWRKIGIEHGYVSAGGDTYFLGQHEGRPWWVGIQHPRNKGENALSVPIENSAVSTSGDYERFFEKSGERHHHIISPKTGRSAKGVASVTVLGKQGIDTDAFSTAVFVLGVEEGLHLINRTDGFDVIIIDFEGKVYFSKGLEAPY